MPPEDRHDVVRAQKLLEEEQQRIEALARRIGRRQGLPLEDLDDFAGDVMVKLVDNDYAVLRAFQGRSKLETFLHSVILHMAQDERVRRWGRWRRSQQARKLGQEAEVLEDLLYRDRVGRDEAVAMFRERFPEVTSARIEEIAAQLRPRVKRYFESEEALVHMPAEEKADDRLASREREERKARVKTVLQEALAALSVESRLVLRWRFEKGLTAAEIARGLGLEPRRVYTIYETARRALRKAFDEAGISGQEALADIGWDFENELE